MPLRFYHYSSQPVNEIRMGTLLLHQGESYSMFDQSKVLIVEFQRPEIQIGLILNKQARLRDGRVVNIGGPCEMEVFPFY
jgi:hypothetical protein